MMWARDSYAVRLIASAGYSSRRDEVPRLSKQYAKNCKELPYAQSSVGLYSPLAGPG